MLSHGVCFILGFPDKEEPWSPIGQSHRLIGLMTSWMKSCFCASELFVQESVLVSHLI